MVVLSRTSRNHNLSMGIHEPEHFPQNLSILNEEKQPSNKEKSIRIQMDAPGLKEIKDLCTLCNECLPCPENIKFQRYYVFETC
ncbi:MAG: hypothetical protein CM1200mP16_00240 [Nitrospina sp.]|nr:MAG: hypothetical protein CM1200mP16_00240 [Nitrospina sp.]